ncbi:tRNA uridine-5-carboxymethylaminomethyl(34) synthesis GTPase MnmE [Butyrivibrio sp. AD3002]|uniref:tRNA uridine-5-carboxymethylaminomethyl(34) synthesis GTPase MnmE n=1 Tax=Butyrivibrio sp. AD3002 TaxID=1280670 RepID=UPI0003B740DB|nr:tRNA uridine-5-carboxymethylaminomethyl(34) synthesis GTPase MnmE [Butyrivibrio sp. AD3002]
MFFKEDTICAIATAMIDAGIGIIRISGEKALSIASKLYVDAKGNHSLLNKDSHTISYGFIVDENENKVDEVMVSLMKAPKSYTKEDVVEINSHGGRLIMESILNLLIKNGCRLAEPGEFTKRAFLNGRIDLTRAEAVMDLIHAQNEFSMKNSERQLGGILFNKIEEIRKEILYEMAYIESAIDDPENYDLTGYDERLKEKNEDWISRLNYLIGTSEEGIIRKEGIKTVIIGKPNAGKSSLLNKLAGEEKAIVTDIEGTTRDIIEETIRLDDIILRVLDTAGIRDTDDKVEKIGVERAVQSAQSADLILYIIDSTDDEISNDERISEIISNNHAIVLLNKNDISDRISILENDIHKIYGNDIPVIKTSMVDDTGIEDLKKIITDMFFNGNIAPKEEIYITNIRQKEALLNTCDSLKKVQSSIEAAMSEDFYSIDLMNAYSFLGEIIGQEVDDDLVEEIFSKFCMGK